MVLAEKIKRPSALAAAALLLLASLLPVLVRQSAAAYGLFGNRYIQMESSASGSTADGQDVIYQVGFDVTTDTSDIAGVVVNFCSNSPIIGDACTAPTGFTIDAANLALTLDAGLTGFTVDTLNSDANTLIITGTAYNPGVSESIQFTLGTGGADGVTNPTNSNTTFYARVLSYTTAAGAQAYTPASPGAEPPLIDAGGVALSTANQITVTAKVQERLEFCVYTSAATANCSTSPTGTAVTLGDTNGVLSDQGPFVDKFAKYTVYTNASSGVNIRAKADATLTSGSFTIDPIGGGTAESAATAAGGVEEYGFCTYRDTVTGATGLVPDAVYDGDDGAGAADDCSTTTQTSGTGSTGGIGNNNDVNFAFVTADLTSTYGDTIATKPAGAASVGVLAFVGNISPTTEPGIYTSTMTFIATGTY